MEILKIKFENKWSFYIPPFLCLALTFALPLLHLSNSRVYNFRIAILQLLIILLAFAIYRKDLFTHFIKYNADKIIILVFLLSGLVSCLNSEFMRLSFIRYFSVIVWFSYFWLLVYLIREELLSSELIILMICLSTIIPIVHYIHFYFTEPVNYFERITERTYYYSHMRHFGYHLLMVSILSFYYLLVPPRKYYINYVLGLLLVSLNSFVLFWSGGRQGSIIFILFFLIFIFKIFKNNTFKYKAYIFPLLFVLLALLFFFFQEKAVFKRLLNTLTDFENISAFLTNRNELWNLSLELLKDHWFFGIGPDSFIPLTLELRPIQPHSVFFQFLLAWGFIGFVLIIILFNRIMVYGISNYLNIQSITDKTQIYIALSSIIAMLLNSIMDGVFYHVLPLTIFISLLSIIIASSGKSKFHY